MLGSLVLGGRDMLKDFLPWIDSNLLSSAPEAGALSSRPQGHM